jgi:hypothetical protein
MTETPERSFIGIAYGGYDGVLQAVDLCGDVKQGRLILTAGGREIVCTLHNLSSDELKSALDVRVMAYGRAYYDGSSGLPMHFDVIKTEPISIREIADLSRWGDTFAISETEWMILQLRS